jgi:hypothetical protein
VYLESNNIIHNGKEQHILKQELPSKELMAYYMEKYEWTRTTYHNINWKEYGRARKRNDKIARYITKLGCCWLPTNDRMKLTEGLSDACKSCGEEETNDHLFTCNSQHTWRAGFYKRLYKHLTKTSTESQMIAIIMHGLRWHYEDYEPTIAIDDEKQHTIGWNHLFRGWVDKAWQPWHEQYIQFKYKDDAKRRDTAKQWTLYLIEFFFLEGHEVWKQRCDKVHAKNKRNETEQSRIRINSKVSALYTMAMEVGDRDRHNIFSNTLEQKQQESVSQLQRWVANTTPAIKQAAHYFNRRNIENTKDI